MKIGTRSAGLKYTETSTNIYFFPSSICNRIMALTTKVNGTACCKYPSLMPNFAATNIKTGNHRMKTGIQDGGEAVSIGAEALIWKNTLTDIIVITSI